MENQGSGDGVTKKKTEQEEEKQEEEEAEEEWERSGIKVLQEGNSKNE